MRCATTSKATPTRNSAIGKCTRTTCCACLASRTVFGSKGCMDYFFSSTMTLATILGWMEQKYEYVPALVKV